MVEIEKNKAVFLNARTKPFVVVGIPAFNEEKSIARVVLSSMEFADEVIVCDDGSTDLTATIAQRLGAEIVRHERNLGYGAGIQSLFSRAREIGADILVTLDGDGQHDPSEIPHVIDPIIKGAADIVVGSRFVDKRTSAVMPWYRRVGVEFISKMTNTQRLRNGVKDAQSGFRAYNRSSIEGLAVSEDGMGASSEILIHARKRRLRICEVSASCNYRNGVRTSTQNPVSHGADVVMSIVRLVVEEKPLRLLGIPGILCLAVGLSFGVWMLQIYALEHRIVTNIALASMGLVMIGVFALFTAITLYAIKRAKDSLCKGSH